MPKLLRHLTNSDTPRYSAESVVKALYRGLLKREPDPNGLAHYTKSLTNGADLQDFAESLLASDEYARIKASDALSLPPLPDLTEIYPSKFIRSPGGDWIFHAKSDSDFELLESRIQQHRYYDRFGVWGARIDFDKRVIAATVIGLGAQSCLEIGCFSGPVLSLLADAGVEVSGLEISHIAHLLAFENVHQRILHGTVLDTQVEKTYDLVLCMDILEHISPLSLPAHLEKLSEIVGASGFLYINSPMFGEDKTFGSPFPIALREWEEAGHESYWRHLQCDPIGWPVHGHLVWASPEWWEKSFRKVGLVRNTQIESFLHELLSTYFSRIAPARQSFFVLQRPEFKPNFNRIEQSLNNSILPLISESI